jgi:hypothetical protein
MNLDQDEMHHRKNTTAGRKYMGLKFARELG